MYNPLTLYAQNGVNDYTTRLKKLLGSFNFKVFNASILFMIINVEPSVTRIHGLTVFHADILLREKKCTHFEYHN